ncbi:hypothetical protein SAMN02745164_01868, partial [Marinitoga hydrogenitolerans DSM 16785]
MATNLLVTKLFNRKVNKNINTNVEEKSSKSRNFYKYLNNATINNYSKNVENKQKLIKAIHIKVKKIQIPTTSDFIIKKIYLGKSLKPSERNFQLKSFQIKMPKNQNNNKLEKTENIFSESSYITKKTLKNLVKKTKDLTKNIEVKEGIKIGINTKEKGEKIKEIKEKTNKIIKEMINTKEKLPEKIEKEIQELREIIEEIKPEPKKEEGMSKVKDKEEIREGEKEEVK